MSREALVLLVCCCDFRDGAERLIPSKSLRNAVIWAFPGLLCILRMCAPRRAAAVVRPRGREKSADRRRRILISRLLIIRTSVPRRKSPFPAYFKGFPAVSPLIPPYPAFLKYPVSPHQRRNATANRAGQKQHKYQFTHCAPPYRTLNDRPVRSSYHNAKECATEFAALRRKYSTKNRIVDRRAFSAKIEDRHDFSIFPYILPSGDVFSLRLALCSKHLQYRRHFK